MTVDFHDSRIDDGVFHIGRIRDSVEEALPHIRFHPVSEPRVDCAPIAAGFRQIAPGASGAHNPQNRLDEEAVVLAAAARVTGLAQTQRLHLRPLSVGQYESFHQKLESWTSPNGNPESQQALVGTTYSLRVLCAQEGQKMSQNA